MADIFDEIQPEQGDIFDQIQPPSKRVFYGPFREQAAAPESVKTLGELEGAIVRPWAQMGKAVINAPAKVVQQTKFLWQHASAEKVLREKDPEKQKQLREQMSQEGESFDKISDWLSQPGKMHEQGIQAILKNHPEWEVNPPENFKDLILNPGKTALALVEATPLLVGAGLLTATGRPDAAIGLMYITEGQNMYDRAKIEGASDQDAALAYAIYGSVSAALENMQLQGIIKVAKGTYNTLLNRTVQKVANQGLKALTYDIIKVAAQEGLEEMSQGAWEDITAKTVYGADIPGGVAGFIDRRAQEGYLGALMGLIPGVAGGVTGVSMRGPGPTVEPGPGPIVTPPAVQPAPVLLPAYVEPELGVPGAEAARFEPIPEKGPIVRGETMDVDLGGGQIVKVGREWADMFKEEGKFTEQSIENIKKAVLANIPTEQPVVSKPIVPKEQLPPELPEMPGAEATRMPAEIGEVPPQQPPTPPIAPPAAEEPEPKKKLRGLSLTQAKKLGHSIPDMLGWTNEQRMDFNKNLVGKTSMKDMSLAEARLVVEGMQAEAERLGFDLTKPEKPTEITDSLIETLVTTKPKITEIEEYNASRWRRFVHGLKKLVLSKPSEILGMPQRFFEALDGKKEGPFQRLIYRPLVEKSALSRINAHDEQMELASYIKETPIKKLGDMWKPQKIAGTKHRLTTMEKLGVYGLAQNETGLKRLLGAKFTTDDIDVIDKSVTPDEKALYEFIVGKFENQWKPLVRAALQADWDVGDLKKEFRYVPIEETDPRNQKDFVDQLVEFATGSSMAPESRMLLLRVPGARGKINLDLAQLYMNNAIRVQRFIQMAPLAKNLRSIMANRSFIDELNRRTFGQGGKILSDYISDKVRGGPVRETAAIEKVFALLRAKATAFAAGRNILMIMRQPLALFTTMSDDPKLIPYVVKNFASTAWPGGSRKLSDFVNERSLFMKDRDIGRETRKIYKKSVLIKTLKNQLSHRSVNWYSAADKNVANAAWKSYYDLSMDKLTPGDETTAMKYADQQITKTQSLIHKEDLPALYRGGEISQSISVFTRELATLGNYWVNDVYGAKIRGEIGWNKFAYRVMMSQIIPALVFGAIAKARPSRTWKEMGIDLAIYTLAPSIFLGGLVNRLITGLDSGMIAMSGWEGLYGVIQQARKLPDWGEKTDEQKAMIIRQLIKKSAITVGAFTGKISAQDIRTLEGAYDLWMQNTTDPRRLIWSEYALTRGEEEEPEGVTIP